MVHPLLNSRLGSLVSLAVLIAVAPVAFPSVSITKSGLVIFIAALAVVGLNLLMGFAGQVSLGHAGFWGLGAYAVAIGPTHLGIPPLVSLLAGLLLTMLIAWLVGRPILQIERPLPRHGNARLRLSRHYGADQRGALDRRP